MNKQSETRAATHTATNNETRSTKTIAITGVEKFSFHGKGGEFFRIWIVNLVLTVLTFGIYSAWATVRNRRYLYSHTELAGDRFSYLAEPKNILWGRIVGISLFAMFSLLQYFAPMASLFALAVLLLAIPWLVVRSLRFNAVMSAWRGVRFGFTGDIQGAVWAYLAAPILGLLTLGIGYPWALAEQNRFVFNHHRFGQTYAATSASNRGFYRIFMLMALIFILGFFLYMLIVPFVAGAAGMAEDSEQGAQLSLGLILMVGLNLLFYLGLYSAFQALKFGLVYDNLAVGSNQIRTSVNLGGWLRVALVNAVLTLLTLGFFHPYAKVRMLNYIFSNLRVEVDDLDGFIANQSRDASAVGDEVGDAFDLGIGI